MFSNEGFSPVNLLSRQEAPPDLHGLYDQADAALEAATLPGPTLFGNQVRALAHNPDLLLALLQVYQSFARTESVERYLVELGILVVSRINACRYCIQHHAPLGHRAGLTKEQLQTIQDAGWADCREMWSEREWLVIQYAEQMTRAPANINDRLWSDMRAHFSDRQIVDLTMRFALCSAWNKFNDALRLDSESAFQHAFAEIGLVWEESA